MPRRAKSKTQKPDKSITLAFSPAREEVAAREVAWAVASAEAVELRARWDEGEAHRRVCVQMKTVGKSAVESVRTAPGRVVWATISTEHVTVTRPLEGSVVHARGTHLFAFCTILLRLGYLATCMPACMQPLSLIAIYVLGFVWSLAPGS